MTVTQVPTTTRRSSGSWLLPLTVAFLVATVFASLACPAEAELLPGTIRGRAVLVPEGVPARAEILVREGGAVVHTSSSGSFEITGLAPGAYTLEASALGRTPATARVAVPPGGSAPEVTLELSPLPRVLSEVVVSPSGYALFGAELSTRATLASAEIREMPHFADDPMRVVRWLPGTTGDELSAQPNIRGGDVDETLVVVDGLEIQDGFHLKELFNLQSIFDAEAVGSLEFTSGGFPVRYGNRLSGVIDIASLSTGGERTSVSASTTGFGVLSEGRLGPGRYLLSLRRTDLGAVISWVDPDNGLEPDFYDVSGTYSQQLGNSSLLAAHVLFSKDTTHYTEQNGRLEELLDASSSNRYAWVNVKAAWTARLYSESIVSYGRVEREREGFIDYPIQAGDVTDTRSFEVLGFKQDWSLDVSPRHTLSWGLDVRRLESSYDYHSFSIVSDPLFMNEGEPHITARDFRLAPSGNSYGIYVAGRMRLASSVVAEAGVRWDRQTWADDSQTSPRLNVVWEAGNRTTVRVAWGLFHQAQGVSELGITDGITTFAPAQRAEHRLVSVEHELGNGLRGRLELYQKRLTRVRPRYQNLLNPSEIFPEIEADRVLVAPDRAEAKGLEMTLRHGGGRWGWWLSYSYSTVKDLIDGRWVPRSWDQPHTAIAGVAAHPGRTWSVDLVGVYHTGWPTTKVYGEAVAVPGGYMVRPRLGPRNAERLPYYLRFDLRTTKEFRRARSTWALFFEVINLTNRDNLARQEGFGFMIRPDLSVATEIEWESNMPIIPALGLRASF